MTKFALVRDINGYVSDGVPLPFTSDMFGAFLTTNVAQQYTVPTTYKNWVAVFSFPSCCDFWVCVNGNAVPPNATIGVVNSVRNPHVKLVKGGDVISIITPNTNGGEFGCELFSLENILQEKEMADCGPVNPPTQNVIVTETGIPIIDEDGNVLIMES